MRRAVWQISIGGLVLVGMLAVDGRMPTYAQDWGSTTEETSDGGSLFDQIENTDTGAAEGDMSFTEGDVEQGVFDEKALACAAGYTCSDITVTLKEAQVLLGYNNAEEAQADYKDQYGKLPEPTDVETDDEMSFELKDMLDQSDPGNDLENASPFPGVTPGHPLDLSSDPGFATSPDQCSGDVLLAPNFMGQRFKSHVCQSQNSNGQLSDCGTHAANLVCLTKGYLKSTCFGVGTAKRSIGNGVICENGQCPAFSFVGCR